ncbi:TraB/GumN family protein [Paraburkholderia sp. JHI869]|uniref:TraB/GumN family protein n=1 Tax=Paraburkholderia sp. JHI869 TaxID=3112959 RepID=UPI00317B50A2
MLWQIEDSNTYVLGSVHLSNIPQLQLPDIAERAFAEAKCVILEADQKVQPDPRLFMMPPGKQLDSSVSTELFRRVREHWLRLGLPEANLLTLSPIMVGTTLQIAESARNRYVAEFGVDTVLRDRAEKAGKEIRYLEQLNDQLRMLVGIPLTEQISYLSHIASQDDVGLAEVAGMISAWLDNDIQYFEMLLQARVEDWPVLVDDVLTKRNINWVPQIVELAKGSNHNLVVVGALHLVGETGLPALFRQHGLALIATR